MLRLLRRRNQRPKADQWPLHQLLRRPARCDTAAMSGVFLYGLFFDLLLGVFSACTTSSLSPSQASRPTRNTPSVSRATREKCPWYVWSINSKPPPPISSPPLSHIIDPALPAVLSSMASSAPPASGDTGGAPTSKTAPASVLRATSASPESTSPPHGLCFFFCPRTRAPALSVEPLC